MSIMIPSCNAHAYMKFSKKNFAPYAKSGTVKNILTIDKYNVGMKSLDRAIIVSDTLKTETSPSFICSGSVSVSGFRIRSFPYALSYFISFWYERNVFLLGKVHSTNLYLTFHMWNELTFSWNELTIIWNDLTIDWNDLTWNNVKDLTMERNDRLPSCP